MGFYGFILVFVGGGLGSALRHGANLLALRLVGSAYPLGTLAINVLGAFVMGVVVEWFALKTSLPQSARLFITTGIDRKSTRLNSSHLVISYAVFCLKKKKNGRVVRLHAVRVYSASDSRDTA